MRLSNKSLGLFTEFFEEVGRCGPDEFPDVRIYARTGARLVTGFLLVDGITIGGAIFVSPRFIKRNPAGRLIISKQLLAHELVHVIQYREQGSAAFLKTYVSDFWGEFKRKKKWSAKSWYEAYLMVPHELEAREYAAKFRLWYESRGRAA